jgi:hypothetical protein
MNPFLAKMRAHSDQELQLIITEKAQDYRPEALEAAKTALLERQINPQALLEEHARLQLTTEEELAQRLEQGESLNTIVASLHAQKLDSFEILNKEEEAFEQNNPEERTRRAFRWNRLTGWFLLGLGILRFFLGLPTIGLNISTFKTIGFVLGGLWLLAYTSGGLSRANKEKPL